MAQRHLLAYIEDAERFVSRDQYCTVRYGHPHKEIGNWRAAIHWALTEGNDMLGGLRLIGEVVCLWGVPMLSSATQGTGSPRRSKSWTSEHLQM